jgi:peptidoglycan/LPS O-acetylase OafA/YrhL
LAQQPDRPLAFLDGLRGLAALWVMLHHARWLLWEGWESFSRHPQDYSALGKAVAYSLVPLRYGHEAVLFFFVLSGFVIHLGYAKRLAADGANARFDWSGYMVRRARRLYPPLVFAMLLTLALDHAGAAQGWSIYRSGTPYALINSSIRPAHDMVTALGNLAFLMQSWVPSWGSNGPLWSLHFEWWFYMIYPALWLVSRRSAMLATFTVAVLFLLSWLVKPGDGHAFHVAQIFTGLFTWWLGALLADIYTGRIRVRWTLLAPLTALLAVLPVATPALGRHWPPLAHGWIPDTLYGLGFAGLFAACFALRERGWPLTLLGRLKPLGDMSYTLYIAHMPILVFIGGWLMSRSRDGVLPQTFGWIAVGAIACLLVSWLAHFAVEKPFTTRKARASA